MTTLTHANRQLFRRRDDERFPTLDALAQYCRAQKQQSIDRWHPPQVLRPIAREGELLIGAGEDAEFRLNDWSFGQLCGLTRVSRDTVNRVFPETAARILVETMPHGRKPLQLLTTDGAIRSIHGVSYTRLWNLDLVNLIREEATDFQPAQEAAGGGTGLYCGEQDLFCFLIDPLGWTEIEGQAFAPGFFVWNSEVGRRSLGISTFWFQAVCQNHIVWDAIEVTEFTRKHTSSVYDALAEVRRIIGELVSKRDARKDAFARVIKSGMQTALGTSAEEAEQRIASAGISRVLAKQALQIAQEQGRLTIFSVVDALTRISARIQNAGDRTDADTKAAQLLALAA